MKNNLTEKVLARLDPLTKLRLKQRADKEGCSESKIVRQALKKFLPRVNTKRIQK